MKTGYEISLAEFLSLCRNHRDQVAPMLRNWFGYQVLEGAPGSPVELLDGAGARIEAYLVHEMIQADPVRQNSIYNLAMTLWR